MKSLAFLGLLLVTELGLAQGIPARLSTETDGPCSARVAYFLTREIEESSALHLDDASPLHMEFRARDKRDRFGLSTGECHFTLTLTWNTYGAQDQDARTQERLTGTSASRGILSERFMDVVPRVGEHESARNLVSRNTRFLDENDLSSRLVRR